MINYRHPQVQADLAELIAQNIPWSDLKDKTVLITGATGMLASYVGFTLLYLNAQMNLNIRPIFLARSELKLRTVYGKALEQCHCLVQDICKPIDYAGNIDYIFHAAGAASPYYILNDPVGIINANVEGTQNILELARKNKTTNIAFASTREVYGRLDKKTAITEDDIGVVDPLNPRNCYPESKRLAEALFMAYYTQYGINFNSLRIAHSYGPGMQLERDGRVMADFLNDAVNGRDIILKSRGEAERAFCYITDAISGVFRVMLNGAPSKAYNVANEKEPIQIIDLANLIQKTVGNDRSVKIELTNSQAGYTDYARTALVTDWLEELGWYSKVCLEDGLTRTIQSILDGTNEN
jgi:nucleoside-diphosphate-sugar epimerase